MRVLNHLNVVALQMGEWEGNVGNDRRTRGAGRRKEEGEVNSLFSPWLKDNIARIQHDPKAWKGCDGGMKEKNTLRRDGRKFWAVRRNSLR